ncbi:MAG: peptidylprolyl isomerase [Planctomycetota bacterium]|jgi:hypothetical protein
MSPSRAFILLLLVLTTVACAGPDPILPEAPYEPTSAGSGGDRSDVPVLDLSAGTDSMGGGIEEARGSIPAGENPVVAEVDGRPVTAADVARFLFQFAPERALDGLNQLVDGHVLEADAKAAGVTLPAGEVEARVSRELDDRETDLRVQFGPTMTLERYVTERFGVTVEAYRRQVAQLVRLQALRDRLVRLEQMKEDRIRIRVLVVDSEEKAREAARRLREGADFTSVARQVSLVQPTELPSYTRTDIEPEALSTELFGLGVGGVSRPVKVSRGDRDLYEVFKVVGMTRARNAPWSEVSGEIERGVREKPVTTAEYLQWARTARERHGVVIHLVEDGAASEGGEEENGR